jgi:Lhr-like helicase
MSYKNFAKKILAWNVLERTKEPVLVGMDEVPTYFLLGMKFWKNTETDEIYAVYTNSELYKDVSEEDLDKIINEDVVSAVKSIATKTGWAKIKSIRERIYLNQSRGAFKKVQALRNEMTDHLRYMRNLKSTEQIFKL